MCIGSPRGTSAWRCWSGTEAARGVTRRLSFCEIHHIKEWGRWGTTDIDNLVALCVSCHHRVHYGGWLIEVEGGSVFFTPPAQIDPSRTRRRGGLANLNLMAELGLESEADLAAVFA